MQHLLDFIHEHIRENQLYLVVDSAEGEIELRWQRQDGDDVWQLRVKQAGSGAEVVHYGDLLDHLEALGADMSAVERELHAIVAAIEHERPVR